MSQMTKQGVRDLNSLGGKRINGKRPPCHHPVVSVYVARVEWVDGQDKDDYGYPIDTTAYPVNILACDICNEEIGPEHRYDVRPGAAA